MVGHKAGERISGKRELSTQPVAARSPGRGRADKANRFGDWHATSDFCQSKTGWPENCVSAKASCH